MKKIYDIVKFWSPLADKIDVNKYNTWLGTQKDLMLEFETVRMNAKESISEYADRVARLAHAKRATRLAYSVIDSFEFIFTVSNSSMRSF